MAGGKIDKVEYLKRIVAIQEWICQDQATSVIINACVTKWEVSERQAYRYLDEAREAWMKDSQGLINAKRIVRIESLKKLKRDMKPEYRGTPTGIRAILAIEKEIARLQGIVPTKEVIDGYNAEGMGKAADPLAPAENKLIIEVLPPYAASKAIGTTD